MEAMLDATDAHMATLEDLVASLEAAEATLSSMQAARDGLLAMANRLAIDIAQQGDHPDRGDMTIRTVAAEIGAAQRVSDRTIERRMDNAAWLVERFPGVWAAQGAGQISAGHSRVIVEAGSHIDDDDARAAYAAEALASAATESPNRLRRIARRLAEKRQPRTIDERHKSARTQRRVWVKDAADGMAELCMHGPGALIHGMFDRLSQMAHAVRKEARNAAEDARIERDDRTVDNIRADLLADLVLTGSPAGHDTPDGLLSQIRGRVEVTVPVTTLMRDDLRPPEGRVFAFGTRAGSGTPEGCPPPPAELDGRVPIDTGTARFLAGTATGWDRVLTHPITGGFLAVDRYRPSKHLRRHLRARDQRCRFPGCGIGARKCDLDHNDAAAAGGATIHSNLADLCRRHHILKHQTPWHVTQRPGGILEWTSPTGRVHNDRPPEQNSVRFTETDAAATSAPF